MACAPHRERPGQTEAESLLLWIWTHVSASLITPFPPHQFLGPPGSDPVSHPIDYHTSPRGPQWHTAPDSFHPITSTPPALPQQSSLTSQQQCSQLKTGLIPNAPSKLRQCPADKTANHSNMASPRSTVIVWRLIQKTEVFKVHHVCSIKQISDFTGEQ